MWMEEEKSLERLALPGGMPHLAQGPPHRCVLAPVVELKIQTEKCKCKGPGKRKSLLCL